MRYSGFHRAVSYIHNVARQRWPIALACEVECDEIDRLRRAAAAASRNKPSYTACVTKAIGMAIAELSPQYPELNSMIGRFLFWRWISRFNGISVGVAVSREEDGLDCVFNLVVPDPQHLSLEELTLRLKHAATAPADQIPEYAANQSMYRLPRLAQRAMLYFGATVPSLHKKHWGTVSLTTVGKFGVDLQMVMPLTTPIQFGFGAVRKRPVVRGDQIVPAMTMNLSMAFDRRFLNGKPPGALLIRVRHILATADDGRWFELRELSDSIK
jgi:pyruvate/2-oxoglutarate dehydrogenase complex dihydrolipoamide acyltransferase (E2) component